MLSRVELAAVDQAIELRRNIAVTPVSTTTGWARAGKDQRGDRRLERGVIGAVGAVVVTAVEGFAFGPCQALQSLLQEEHIRIDHVW